MAVERRNQKALGDTENLATGHVVEGKSLLQVSRRIIRSFCAQLLANNAQAAADSHKKSMVVNVKGANVAKAPKPAQKKATVKSWPEEIIVISPNTREKLMKKNAKEEKS